MKNETQFSLITPPIRSMQNILHNSKEIRFAQWFFVVSHVYIVGKYFQLAMANFNQTWAAMCLVSCCATFNKR